MASATCPLVWQEGVKRGSGSGQRRECQCSHSKATLASAGTISTYIMDRGAPALPGSRGSIDTATQSVVSSQGVNREM